MTAAAKDRTDLDLLDRITIFIYTDAHDLACSAWCDHVVCLYDQITVFIFDIFAGETSCDTVFQTFDRFFSIHECFYIHTWDFAAVFTTIGFTDDQFL